MSENNLVDEVKNAANIVDVISEFIPLIKKGKNYKALCPFHEDSHPSMSISEEKQIFNCFSCNTGGNAISFYSKFKKISFRRALEELAKKYNIKFSSANKPINKYNDKTQGLINILNRSTLYYQNELYSKNGLECLKYLHKRGISDKQISSHKIGFASEKEGISAFLLKDFEKFNLITAGVLTQNEKLFFSNRLMFPITNNNGDVVGFSGRTLSDNKIKYINSSENIIFTKSKLLYNYFNAREFINQKKEVFITEGYFDVLAVESLGYMNVVALMGTALTSHHIILLKKLTVTLILDSDTAGIASIKKSVKLLLRNQINTYIVINNENLDPDEYLKKYGDNKTKDLINNKKDAFLFLIEDYKKNQNISNPSILENILKELSFMIPRNNSNLYSIYKNKIKESYGVSNEIISNYFSEYIKIPTVQNNYQEQKNEYPIVPPKFIAPRINYFNILKWTLLSDNNYCKLYLKLNPLMTSKEALFLKEIARNQGINPKIIETEKIKFLKENNNVEPKIINSKNLFYDIIEKLSIESLENLEKHLLQKLLKINKNNEKEINETLLLKKSVKKKLNILKKERKDGKN